uniref:Uncharacterized protein n=1 Tax=Aegilops tauschii TaxID=37682 RepID=M8BMV5_AEGTA
MVPDWAQVTVVQEQGIGVFAEDWRGRMRRTGRRRWLARRTSSREKETGDSSHTVLLPAAVGWLTRRASASSPP